VRGRLRKPAHRLGGPFCPSTAQAFALRRAVGRLRGRVSVGLEVGTSCPVRCPMYMRAGSIPPRVNRNCSDEGGSVEGIRVGTTGRIPGVDAISTSVLPGWMLKSIIASGFRVEPVHRLVGDDAARAPAQSGLFPGAAPHQEIRVHGADALRYRPMPRALADDFARKGHGAPGGVGPGISAVPLPD